MLQFQHGSYTFLPNASLSLTPISHDGRHLVSEPCKSSKSVYLRYNQSELMSRYAVYEDPYHGIERLDLYAHDGKPLPQQFTNAGK